MRTAIILGLICGYATAITRFAPDCGPASAWDVVSVQPTHIPALPPPPENRTWRSRVEYVVDRNGDVWELVVNWSERY